MGTQVLLPGFAQVAIQLNVPDTVIPAVSLLAPRGSVLGEFTQLFWSAVGVAQFSITGTNGYSSGVLSAAATSGFLFVPPFTSTGTFEFTINGLDNQGNPVLVSGSAVTASISLTIT